MSGGTNQTVNAPIYSTLWEDYLKIVGRERINIQLQDILTSFAAEGFAKPYAIVDHYVIPPLTTLNIYATVPSGYVNVMAQIRFYVSQDNATSSQLYFDDYLFAADQMIIQKLYDSPYDAITQLVAVIPAKRYIRGVHVNYTTSYIDFAHVVSGFLVPSKTWNKLEDKLFKAVLRYVGEQ